MRRLLLAAVLLLLIGAPTAHAGWDPYATPTRATFRALKLVGRAAGYVAHAHRRCRVRFTPSSWTHDAPSSDLLGSVGVMRQPATSEDRLSRKGLHDLPGVGVYSDWVRVAHDRSGRAFYVFGARDFAGRAYGPAACGTLERGRLRRLLLGRPRRLAHLALSMETGFNRARYPARPRGPQEEIGLFEHNPKSGPDGVGDGTWSVLVDLRKQGLWLTSLGGEHRFTLLVPDGVATVTAVYPRIGRKPLRGQRKVYAERIKRTAPVQENLATLISPRKSGWDWYPTRVVWRAASGSVIQTTGPPALWWLLL